MGDFEKTIKDQLLAYQRELILAQQAERLDNVSMIRAQIAAFRLGLETCLNKKFVGRIFDSVKLMGTERG